MHPPDIHSNNLPELFLLCIVHWNSTDNSAVQNPSLLIWLTISMLVGFREEDGKRTQVCTAETRSPSVVPEGLSYKASPLQQVPLSLCYSYHLHMQLLATYKCQEILVPQLQRAQSTTVDGNSSYITCNLNSDGFLLSFNEAHKMISLQQLLPACWWTLKGDELGMAEVARLLSPPA